MRDSRPFVLWDFNGTLIDDAWLCVECLNELCRRRGIPEVPLELFLGLFRFPVVEFYKDVGFTFEREPYAAVAEEWAGLYHERLWTEVRLRAGAAETVEAVRALGWRQGVLSAYRRDMLERAVAHFGLRGSLDPLLGAGDLHAHGKEEAGTRWAASCGLALGRLVLVGDTLHDRDVARAMGIRCVLVAGGHQARSRLEASGLPVLDDIRAVPKAVEP